MPHVETYGFGSFLIGNHITPGVPTVYVEYGPFVHQGVGTVVAAGEFISVITLLSTVPKGALPLHATRDCCSGRPREVSLPDEAKWDAGNSEAMLRVGPHSFTEAEFRGLVEWLAAAPFLDPRHVPHLELSEGTQVRFGRLCQRLGIKAP